jgi:hypothetical protein
VDVGFSSTLKGQPCAEYWQTFFVSIDNDKNVRSTWQHTSKAERQQVIKDCERFSGFIADLGARYKEAYYLYQGQFVCYDLDNYIKVYNDILINWGGQYKPFSRRYAQWGCKTLYSDKIGRFVERDKRGIIKLEYMISKQVLVAWIKENQLTSYASLIEGRLSNE